MGLCSGARFGCSGVIPEHVFSVPEHVFSAPEQKIFLRATRENMFRKRVIIFGALKNFASHTGTTVAPTITNIEELFPTSYRSLGSLGTCRAG